MGQKIKRDKNLNEEAELEAYIAAQKKARKGLVKKILILIVCVGLIFCFCLPSISALL